MKLQKSTKIILIVIVLLLLAGAALGYYFRGAAPAFLKPSEDISNLLPGSTPTSTSTPATATSTPPTSTPVNTTKMPLKLPDGFSISIFAKNLPAARVMAFDSLGNMWVSQISQGTISQIEIKNGVAIGQNVIFKNLKNPHGLAIDGNTLYFAEENKISRVAINSNDSPQKIADLPSGGGHTSRTIGFGPDGRLYVSVGSSCNACQEQDPRRAAISYMNKDGSDFKQVATGLRNSVFFTWGGDTKTMVATDMGRDNLGDNLPPDEINFITSLANLSGRSHSAVSGEDQNYGWPICYGQNIHDTNFDKNVYIQNPCNGKIPPRVEIPAHSAPLGLVFVPDNAGWPKDHEYELLVAYHGSWNSSVPVGYKIVLMKFNIRLGYISTEDFITGWLPAGATGAKGALGRPVDIIFKDDIMYVSDDKAGVIYKVEYRAK